MSNYFVFCACTCILLAVIACFELIIFYCFRKGTGYPKVLKIDVRGELVEGNIIRGYPEVAWCGGTPGKGVAR